MTQKLILCEECKSLVTTDEIGHSPDCSKCIDDGSEKAAKKWLASIPPAVRAAFEKYPATHLYRMKDTDQRVYILSYSENADGSVTHCIVAVRAKFNPEVFIDRDVFDVELASLEDLGEYLGD